MMGVTFRLRLTYGWLQIMFQRRGPRDSSFCKSILHAAARASEKLDKASTFFRMNGRAHAENG